MYVAQPQLRRKTVALAVEQQQRVIARRLKVPVIGAVLLLPVHRDLCLVTILSGCEINNFAGQSAKSVCYNFGCHV